MASLNEQLEAAEYAIDRLLHVLAPITEQVNEAEFIAAAYEARELDLAIVVLSHVGSDGSTYTTLEDYYAAMDAVQALEIRLDNE